MIPEQPAALNQTLDLEEIHKLLTPIGLDPHAVQLVKSIGDDRVYLDVRSPLLQPVAKDLVRVINKLMPEGTVVKAMPRGKRAGFAKISSAYRLSLVNSGAPTETLQVTTWESLLRTVGDTAPKAILSLFKAQGNPYPNIPFRVCKADEQAETTDERIVCGVVLEPDTIDSTKSKDPDTGEEVVGDIYDAEAIRQAMYWWMENARHTLSYHHVTLGGRKLMSDEASVLECWQVRDAYTEAGQAIKAGTWMLTARINNDKLWQDIKTGKVQSWSIGADGMGYIERVAI